MKRKIRRKALVNWGASLLSIGLLLAIVATPVIASVSAGWVTSTDIKDNTILNRDIAPNKISSSRIKDYTIVKEDIHSASINKYKLMTGAVTSAKILDGSILNRDIASGAAIAASKINTSGLNADKVDGKHASAFLGNAGPQSIDDTFTAKGYSYDTTKTGVIAVPAIAFRPRESDTTFTSNGITVANPGSSTLYLAAPVNLPDGAIVTKLSYEALDNTGDGNSVRVSVYRTSMGASETMAQTNGSNNSPSWQTLSDTSINFSKVDNASRAYSMSAAFSGGAGTTNLRGSNAYIEFTYSSPGY